MPIDLSDLGGEQVSQPQPPAVDLSDVGGRPVRERRIDMSGLDAEPVPVAQASTPASPPARETPLEVLPGPQYRPSPEQPTDNSEPFRPGDVFRGLGVNMGGAGKVVEAVVGDAARAMRGERPENIPALPRSIVFPNEQLPIEQDVNEAAKEPGSLGAVIPARISLGLAKSAPKIGMVMASGGAGGAAGLLTEMGVAGGLFGMDDEGNFHPREAVIGALLPGVGKVARVGVGALIGKSLAAGLPLPTGHIAQKLMETIGEQAAMDAWMTLAPAGWDVASGKEPELLTLAKQDPKAAVGQLAETIGSNLAFALFGVGKFGKDVPSDTKAWVLKNADTLATKKIIESYPPDVLRDIYNRVNRSDPSVTPAEKDLVSMINRTIESPKEAIKKGVEIYEQGWPEKLAKMLGEDAVSRGVQVSGGINSNKGTSNRAGRSLGLLTEKGQQNAINPEQQQTGVPPKRGGANEVGQTGAEAGAGDSVPGAAGQPEGPGVVPVPPAAAPEGPKPSAPLGDKGLLYDKQVAADAAAKPDEDGITRIRSVPSTPESKSHATELSKTLQDGDVVETADDQRLTVERSKGKKTGRTSIMLVGDSGAPLAGGAREDVDNNGMPIPGTWIVDSDLRALLERAKVTRKSVSVDTKPAESFAKSSGWDFKANDFAALNTQGMPPEMVEHIRKTAPPTWEFTDRRPDSPTQSITFYVPAGSTLEQIQKAHDAKVRAFTPVNKPSEKPTQVKTPSINQDVQTGGKVNQPKDLKVSDVSTADISDIDALIDSATGTKAKAVEKPKEPAKATNPENQTDHFFWRQALTRATAIDDKVVHSKLLLMNVGNLHESDRDFIRKYIGLTEKEYPSNKPKVSRVKKPLTKPAAAGGMEALKQEVSQAPSINAVSGKSSGLLFHGTAQGRNITKFSLENANWGVGSNAFSQGNGGVYLTDSVQAARYFSRKAGESEELTKGDKAREKTGETVQEAHNYAHAKLFGPKDGNIVAVRLPADAKIKQLDHAPNPKEVEQFKADGFDGVSFPEVGMKNAEDYPHILTKQSFDLAVNSRTTFVFDPNKIEVVSNIANLEDLKQQPAPVPSPAPKSSPKAAAKSALDSAKEAASESFKALDELFGGDRIGVKPQEFSEESYQRAKPHIRNAWEAFKKFGQSLKEFFDACIDRWGDGIKPYLKRFMRDLQEEAKGANVSPDADKQPEGAGGGSGTGGGEPAAPGATGGVGAPAAGDQGQGGSVQPGTGKKAGSGSKGGRRPAGGKPDANAGGQAGEQEPETTDTGAGATGPASPEQLPGEPTEPDSPGLSPKGNQPKNLYFESDPSPTGPRARIQANLEAIVLVKDLEKSGRFPDDKERRQLAAWSGWGAFKELFNEGRAESRGYDVSWQRTYGKAFDVLKGLLTEAEFNAAAESSVNAHYTNQEVLVDGMWAGALRMGFSGGRVLEPGAGKGSAIAFSPKELRNKIRWGAIEMDQITGKILGYLFPEADVQIKGFEDAKIPNAFYDMMLCNIPFHETGPGKEFPDMNLHNYFIARGLSKVRPGGLVVVITSKGTMDNRPEQRRKLAEMGQLVGAIRLPNTAFKENAGTEVVTDILFIRKPDGKPFEGSQKWESTKTLELQNPRERTPTHVEVNEYFIDHPEMVLGKHALTGSMYGKNEYTVESSGPLGPKLQAAVAKLPENIFNRTEESMQEPVTTQLDDYTLVTDAKGNVLESRNYKLELPSGWDSSSKELVKRARDYIKTRDLLLNQYALERSANATDEQIEANRKKLALQYRAWVKAHGTLNQSKKARYLSSDPAYYTVLGLENVKEEIDPQNPTETRTVVYEADVLSKRMILPDLPPDKADSATDALGIVLSYRGKLDIDYIRELTGLTQEQIESDLIGANLAFKDPESGQLMTSHDYLTGEVRDKLAKAMFAAKESPLFQRNVDALKGVIPPTVPFDRMQFDITARWTPMPVLNLFAEKVIGLSPASISFVPKIEEFAVKEQRVGELAKTRWSTERMSAPKLLDHALNFKRAEIKDRTDDDKYVVNEAATALANQMISQMKQEYVTWARKSEETIPFRYFDENRGEYVTEKLPVWDVMEREFNRKTNSFVVPERDGSMLRLPGLTESVRRTPHLMNGVMRAIVDGSAVYAHGVGSGKTFLLIIAAHELQRIGLAKKPVIVVKKPTVDQYRMSILRAYPGARMLIPSKKDFETANRQKLISRIASTKWDFIVLTHEQFKSIKPGEELVKSFFEDQLKQLRQILKDRGQAGAELAKSTRGMDSSTRNIVRKLKELKKRMTKHLDSVSKRQDKSSSWENLGIDGIFVDESHNFKKMPIPTQMDGEIKGIPNDFSQRAVDLLVKVRDIQRVTSGRNVFFASGTPVSNTLAELWVQFHATNPKLLKDFSIETFDSFASTYAEVVTNLELGWDNNFKNVTRLSRFKNPAGFTTLVRMGMDVKIGNKELGLDVPEMEGGKMQVETIKSTPAFQQWLTFLDRIVQFWDSLDPKGRWLNSWVPIATMRAGVAAALDPRLVFPDAEDHPNSKVNQTVRGILEEWAKGKELRTTMMVFADMYRTMNTDKLRAAVGGGHLDTDDDDSNEPEIKGEEDDDVEEGAKDEAAYIKNAVGTFNLYNDIRAKLIAGGVPEHEIGVITEHDTDAKRDALFNKVRNGMVRILIGSTEKIGEGVDVPQRMSAQFHLDPPMQMTAAKLEQRLGRIIRQGNMFSVKNLNVPVRVKYYAMERSMDAAILQLMQEKSIMTLQAMKGQYLGDSFDDPASALTMALAEMKAAATGDNRVLEMAKLQQKVRELSNEEGAYLRRVSELRRAIEESQRTARSQAEISARNVTLHAAAVEAQGDENTITMLHVRSQKRITGEDAIKDWLKKMREAVDETLKPDDSSTSVSLIFGEKLRAYYEGKHSTYHFTTYDDKGAAVDNIKHNFYHSVVFYLGGQEPGYDSPRYDSSSLESIESILAVLGNIPKKTDERIKESAEKAASAESSGKAFQKELENTKFDKAAELSEKNDRLRALESELRGERSARIAAANAKKNAANPPAPGKPGEKPPEQDLPQGSIGEGGGDVERGSFQTYSIDQLRSALPHSGLSEESQALLRSFLDLPVTSLIRDQIKVKVSDALDNGWQGSYFNRLASIARTATATTGPEELLHAVWEILPDDMKAEFERMRVAALDDLIKEATDNGQPERAKVFQDVRDNPCATEEFIARQYPVAVNREAYTYSSANEFFAQSASQRHKRRVGSMQEGFWAKVKGIINQIIAAIKRALRLKPTQTEMLDRVLDGKFEPAAPEMMAERQAEQGSITRDEAIAEGETERRIPTQVFGEEYYVLDREQINPTSIAASADMAKRLLDESKIPATEIDNIDDAGRSRKAWLMTPQGFNMSESGRQLLAKLKEAITGSAPGKASQELANILNSIVINFEMGAGESAMSEMSPGVRNELWAAAQSDRSARGIALAALAGYAKDLKFVGRNMDVELGKIWNGVFGGDELRKVLDELKEARKALAKAQARVDELEAAGVENEELRKANEALKNANAELAAALEAAAKKKGRKGLRRAMRQSPRLSSQILEAIKEGGEAWDILKAMAEANGWKVPTDVELDRIKNWVEEWEALEELSPDELSRAGKDKRAQAAALAEKLAVTEKRRIDLRKQIETAWTRFTKPLTLKTATGRVNVANAIGEYASANLLLKVGFATRQTVDVLTQGLFHTPSRAIQSAIGIHSSEVEAGRRSRSDMTSLIADASDALAQAYQQRIAALRPTLMTVTEVLRGHDQGKHVARLMGRVSIFDRAMQKAEELKAQGKTGEAFLLRVFTLMRLGYRVAQAMDNLHGQPAVAQEMRQQVVKELRENGLSRAEADQKADWVMGDMKAEFARAIPDAQNQLAANGITADEREVRAAAWRLVRARQYARMRDLHLDADDFEGRNDVLLDTLGWNLPEEGGVGGAVANAIRGVGRFAETTAKSGPISLAAMMPVISLSRFSNAIGILINRKLSFTPLGWFPGWFGVDMDQVNMSEDRIATSGSPWFRTDEDRRQRKTEAVFGTSMMAAIAALAAVGAIIVRNKWPKDKDERQLWDRMGWKPGQVEIPTGGGKSLLLSMNTGPLVVLSPGLSGGGALHDLLADRAKRQKSMDEEAAKLGLTPGKIQPMSQADLMGVAAEAAWGSIISGRTLSGLLGSVSDFGQFHPVKTVASTLSTFTPGMPGTQELDRMAFGVVLDSKMASVWDFMMPLPSSGAAQVNMLGDRVGDANGLQRVITTLTGGNYPFPLDDKQRQAQDAYRVLFESGYRPPAIEAGKFYAIGNEYRPFTDKELQKYALLRGKYLKEGLQYLNPDDKDGAKLAFKDAQQHALGDLGATQASAMGQSAASGQAASNGMGYSAPGKAGVSAPGGGSSRVSSRSRGSLGRLPSSLGRRGAPRPRTAARGRSIRTGVGTRGVGGPKVIGLRR